MNRHELSLSLTDNEREAILTLCSALSSKLSNNLVHLYLFGSRARGDFEPDSDIDLLVVLRRLDAESRWLVRATAADYSLLYDVLFNTHLYELTDWQDMATRQDTLWRHVRRDGVLLEEAEKSHEQ